jgi:hypothetical protein
MQELQTLLEGNAEIEALEARAARAETARELEPLANIAKRAHNEAEAAKDAALTTNHAAETVRSG